MSLDDNSLSSRGAIGEIIEEGVGVIALISSRFSDRCLFCRACVSKFGSIGVENTNAANLGSSANRWMTILAGGNGIANIDEVFASRIALKAHNQVRTISGVSSID